MDKKNKKILLLTISIIWILIEFLLEGSIIDKIMNTGFEPFENITFILAIILLVIGICIEIPKKEINNNNRKIIKYQILRVIGYLPFIGILLFGIISMFNGFTFLSNTDYGFDALIGTIVIYSIIIWPLYIVGLVLIIVSNKKIKKITSGYSDSHKENGELEQAIPFIINNEDTNSNNNNK